MSSPLMANSTLSVWEAEHLVKDLIPFSISDVGSEEWMKQHENLEKLNIQAHHNAQTKHDEYVYEAFLSLNKLPLLVHDLLVIEAWREKIFPQFLKEDLVDEQMSLKIYMVLYHEATINNLLEVFLFHRPAVLSLDGDALAELIDYCYRFLTQLHAGLLDDDFHQRKGLVPTPADKPADALPSSVSEDALAAALGPLAGDPAVAAAVAEARATLQQGAAETVQQRLARQSTSILRSASVCVVSTLRFVTDAVGSLSHGTLYRMANKHDLALALVPLVVRPPWTRRVRRQPTVGELLAAAKADPPAALPAARWVLEKYLDQRWVEVAVDEEAQLSKTEAQLWLALYNLLLDPAVRDIYEFTRHRADAVSALKGRFTEPVLDQLPLLGDLRRLVEEVSIALPPQQPARALAIVEQVPELRVTILSQLAQWHRQRRAGGKAESAATGSGRQSLLTEDEEDLEEAWCALARYHASSHFSTRDAASLQRQLAGLAQTYSTEALEAVMSPPACAQCGGEAVHRCSRCKSDWYCGRACQVQAWPAHKALCAQLKQAAEGGQ